MLALISSSASGAAGAGPPHADLLPVYDAVVACATADCFVNLQVAKLRARGHRMLIYSQFTMLLDLLEEWLVGRQWPYFRLDGTVGAQKLKCLNFFL